LPFDSTRSNGCCEKELQSLCFEVVILGASGTGEQKVAKNKSKAGRGSLPRLRVQYHDLQKKRRLQSASAGYGRKNSSTETDKKTISSVPPRRFVRILQVKTAQGAQGQGQKKTAAWALPATRSQIAAGHS
jgi:hypothetical protein